MISSKLPSEDELVIPFGVDKVQFLYGPVLDEALLVETVQVHETVGLALVTGHPNHKDLWIETGCVFGDILLLAFK